MLAYAGPGYLVSVGYMDPGNWATDIAGGSKFGYTLLSVILLSNLMAILLQSLCVRLGVATGRDLAQACRDYFSPRVNFCLWVLCEIAIAACDLAELLGSAIDAGARVLFGPATGFEVEMLFMRGALTAHPEPRNRRGGWLEMPVGQCYGETAIVARKVAELDPGAVRWPADRKALEALSRLYPE